MPGILNFLQAAIGPAAAARSGYLAGQEQAADKRAAQERQSLMDQMERRLKESQVGEAEARSRYYDRPSAQSDKKLYESDAGPVLYDPSGTATPLLDALGNRIKGPDKNKDKEDEIKEFSRYSDEGEGSVSDITAAGKRINTRPATASERNKFRHMPREPKDPNEMNDAEIERYLGGVADQFVTAANGDERQAAELAARDPRGLAAFKRGLGTGHFGAAADRYKRQATIDTDRHKREEQALVDESTDLGTTKNGTLEKPNNSSATKPEPRIKPPQADTASALDFRTPAPVTTPTKATTRPGAGPTPKESTVNEEGASGKLPVRSESGIVAEVIARIERSGGTITPEQALRSPALSSAVKRAIRKRYGLP